MNPFQAALEARLGGLPADTDAFRWVDEEVPDVTVDLFDDVAILSLYRAFSAAEELEIAQQLQSLGESQLRSARAESRAAPSAEASNLRSARAESRAAPSTAESHLRSASRAAPPTADSDLTSAAPSTREPDLRSARFAALDSAGPRSGAADRVGRADQKSAGLRAIYVKRRPHEARRAANEDSEAVAPRTPLLGTPVEPLTVREAGVRFEIRPDNGLSVGLYLDSRDARAWVRAHARDRTVLNLFAYTCGFGVAARLGGATRAVNVDTSRKVLDWGERNAALNGLAVDRRDFLSGDALDWLRRFTKKNERFGLIVLDPPGFATTRDSRFSAVRDYHRLVEAAAAVTAPDGLLLAMCNVAAMDQASFHAQLVRGLGRRRHRVLERFGASRVDFRGDALKCVAIELA